MKKKKRTPFCDRIGGIMGQNICRNLLTGSVFITGGILWAADEGISEKPNVIFCMADDLGWGDTGYNGHPVLRTPNLNRMAQEGVRFDRFYSAAPVCSPTRGSCLTGRHPYRYGVFYANTGHMKKEEITIADVLKEKGYVTGHFGKWHLGTLTKTVKDANRGGAGDAENYSPPWENGFDVCFSTESKVPTYWKNGVYETFGTHYWTGPDQMVPAAEVSGDDSTLIMNRTLPFIRDAVAGNHPFMAVIWFHTPHLPVVSAPPYTDGYDAEHRDYYGCITAMDEQIGRLREELDRLGVSKKTMIWFCSDNGPEGQSKDPGSTRGLRGRKRSLHEGGVRVPGLLVWPQAVKHQVVSIPCSTSDYFPTVMDVLGYKIPETKIRPYDGISILPVLSGTMTKRSRPIMFESRDQVALIGDHYKIYSKDKGTTYELYDLIKDPCERKNIADQFPEIVMALAGELEKWRQSCAASVAGKDY